MQTLVATMPILVATLQILVATMPTLVATVGLVHAGPGAAPAPCPRLQEPRGGTGRVGDRTQDTGQSGG